MISIDVSSRVLRSAGGATVLALTLAACGGGPGSQQDLEEVLIRDGFVSEEDAVCISKWVFDEYEDDEEALSLLSAADDFEFLTGPNGVEGFGEAFDAAVSNCQQVGP